MFGDIRGDVQDLHNKLREDGSTLSVAESCTGGLLGGALTSVGGSSDVFEGGAIAYSNRMKQAILDVDEASLAEHGAVSRTVARAMALGAADTFGTNYAVAVTGIAGPSGGTEEKPVGLVHFGFVIGGTTRLEKRVFEGDREGVRFQSVEFAIKIMLESLSEAIG